MESIITAKVFSFTFRSLTTFRDIEKMFKIYNAYSKRKKILRLIVGNLYILYEPA